MWLIWSDIIFELFIEVDPDTGKTLGVDRKYLAASADPRAERVTSPERLKSPGVWIVFYLCALYCLSLLSFLGFPLWPLS